MTVLEYSEDQKTVFVLLHGRTKTSSTASSGQKIQHM